MSKKIGIALLVLLPIAIGLTLVNAWGQSPPPPTPTATPQPTATAEVRAITITDEEIVPLLPIKGAMVHFRPDNKVAVGYKGVWLRTTECGVAEGKIWVSGVPSWLDLSRIDKEIGSYTSRSGGKLWLTALPPWLDLSKYDKDITKLPIFLSLETDEGRATITYLP